MLYYTILYYTVLYTVLCYTLLYSTLLYSTLLYSTILYYTILYYTILYYTILYYILYDAILYYIIPEYSNTRLCSTILYHTYHTLHCAGIYYTIVMEICGLLTREMLYFPEYGLRWKCVLGVHLGFRCSKNGSRKKCDFGSVAGAGGHLQGTKRFWINAYSAFAPRANQFRTR